MLVQRGRCGREVKDLKMLSRNVCSIYPKCRGTEYFGNKATYFKKTSPHACNSQNNAVYRLYLSSLTKLIGSIYFAVEDLENAVQKCMQHIPKVSRNRVFLE